MEQNSKTIKSLKPDILSPLASARWDEVIDDLIQSGMMKNIYITMLILYCETYARWESITHLIEKGDHIITLSDGNKTPSLLIEIANTAYNQMRSLEDNFFITPTPKFKMVSTTINNTAYGL